MSHKNYLPSIKEKSRGEKIKFKANYQSQTKVTTSDELKKFVIVSSIVLGLKLKILGINKTGYSKGTVRVYSSDTPCKDGYFVYLKGLV